MKKLLKIALTLVITVILVTGIISPEIIMGTPASPAIGNWYQQFMPNINGASIRDIVFTDSLNGFIVTSIGGSNSYILKTTNSGDNWVIKFNHTNPFVRVRFVNNNTGFTNAFQTIFKTTNAGENWNPINLPGIFGDDMFVLNDSTIWLAMSETLTGGVFFTSNGGVSWVQQFSGGNQNPNKIYMYNSRIGFMSNNSALPNIYKTTNSGENWTVNLSGENFYHMQFIDSLVGWKSSTFSNLVDSSMKKTTNGGITWFKQYIPTGSDIIQFGISGFSCLNKDTVWAVGNSIFFPNSQVRGMVFRTINGGANWLYQIPDTIINTSVYYFIQFVNRNNGWAYNTSLGIHTTTGGDPVWITALEQLSTEIPKEFKLFQNYPNPFNPNTKIKFQLLKRGNAEIIIYDVTGKRIQKLLNEELSAGEYEIDFNASGLSSGTYFYKLIINSGKEVFNETKKMVLIK